MIGLGYKQTIAIFNPVFTNELKNRKIKQQYISKQWTSTLLNNNKQFKNIGVFKMSQQQKSLTFLSLTAMGRDEQSKLLQLLGSIINAYDSVAFREPVDWKAFNLLDYPTIITKPMDLGTVKKKIGTKMYENVQDCLEDIVLIWQNAKLYNPKEHQIHKLADKFEKQTKKMIRNYLPFVKMQAQSKKKQPPPKKQAQKQQSTQKPVKAPEQPKTYLQKQQQPAQQSQGQPAQPPHITQRKNLLCLFQLCSKEQIGVIFQLIKSNCPQAIEYEDNGAINIRGEKIHEGLGRRLSNLVDMWGIGVKAARKK